MLSQWDFMKCFHQARGGVLYVSSFWTYKKNYSLINFPGLCF
uniref:Uncharacterized protein n=1 Tax=Anguilla anguilla TaxID=7936 RepID=A0A0E9TTD4_ANGAN